MSYFISRVIDQHVVPPVLELVGTGSPTSITASVGAGSIAIQTDAGAGAGLWCYTAGAWVQAGTAGASGPPTGAAGGDLTGTYPNPGVGKVNAATFPLGSALLLGDLLYASAAAAYARLAGNITTAKQFLTQTGTGTVSAVPAWAALVAADIPSLDAAKITSGVLPIARLATGTPTGALFIRDDGTLAAPAGGGGGGASITVGAYASLPGSGTTTGDTYYCTDSMYSFVWTGSAWQAIREGVTVTRPAPNSGWTQLNAGGKLTITDQNGSIRLLIADTTALNWRALYKAVPSTPYHIEFFWSADMAYINSQTSGIYFYNGTKLYGLEMLTQATISVLRVEKITNVTTDGSTPYSRNTGNWVIGPHYGVGGMWGRLGNDGTNLTFDWARKKGRWNQVWTEAVGTYMTPTHYGFGGVSATGSGLNSVQMDVEVATVTA